DRRNVVAELIRLGPPPEILGPELFDRGQHRESRAIRIEARTFGDMDLHGAARLSRVLVKGRLDRARAKDRAFDTASIELRTQGAAVDERRAEQLERPRRA